MHCDQARQQIESLPHAVPPPAELTHHTAQCSACAQFLAQRRALSQALARLRAETAQLGPSSHVEQQVLAALRPPARPARPRRRPVAAAALAFAVLLLAAVLFGVSRTHPPAPMAELPHEEPFTAMPYVAPPAPSERTTIVRTQVSSQIVQYAGLQVRDEAAPTSLADVVLGQGGRIVALRLVAHPQPASAKRIN